MRIEWNNLVHICNVSNRYLTKIYDLWYNKSRRNSLPKLLEKAITTGIKEEFVGDA
jgi:23S rRNA A2030 N6-methylase RlmJ